MGSVEVLKEKLGYGWCFDHLDAGFHGVAMPAKLEHCLAAMMVASPDLWRIIREMKDDQFALIRFQNNRHIRQVLKARFSAPMAVLMKTAPDPFFERIITKHAKPGSKLVLMVHQEDDFVHPVNFPADATVAFGRLRDKIGTIGGDRVPSFKAVTIGDDTLEHFFKDHFQCARCATKTGRLRTCTGCKTVKYCSKECQVIDWRDGGHKSVCGKKSAV